MKLFTPAALLGATLLLGITANAAYGEEAAVAEGKLVGMEYTLTLDDGTVADTSIGRGPMIFTQGEHQIITGLERAIDGMKVNESKKVVVVPEDAYGDVQQAAFREVPLSKLPEENRTVGEVLIGQSPTGQQMPVRIHEIKGENAVLDFNHPMAGKTLTFDVKIVSID